MVLSLLSYPTALLQKDHPCARYNSSNNLPLVQSLPFTTAPKFFGWVRFYLAHTIALRYPASFLLAHKIPAVGSYTLGTRTLHSRFSTHQASCWKIDIFIHFWCPTWNTPSYEISSCSSKPKSSQRSIKRICLPVSILRK
jgi:hypothetical protein